jgi:hypothetical protein
MRALSYLFRNLISLLLKIILLLNLETFFASVNLIDVLKSPVSSTKNYGFSLAVSGNYANIGDPEEGCCIIVVIQIWLFDVYC